MPPVSPPRRLTKQQFLHKRPQGNYQAYTRAYTRQHGGPHGPTAQGRPNQPFTGPTYESLLRGIQIESPAQMEARANRMVQQQIAAQQKMIREEAKLMRDEAMRRMQAQAAAGRAAAAQNAGLFGAVGGEYNAAANEIRNLGTNMAGQVAGMTSADVSLANAQLGAIGAPGPTVGGPPTGLGIAGDIQANVEAYRGGELPGMQLGTAGQAATFGLAGMVSAQNLRATQEAQAGMNEAVRAADLARTSAMKELQMGRPAAAAQFLTQLQEANSRGREIAMSLLAARQQFGLQNQENTRATNTSRQDRQTSILNRQLARRNAALAEQQAALTGREIDADRSFATGIYVDKMGRPILGKDGKTIPWKQPPSTSTVGSGPGGAETLWEENRYDIERSAKEFVYNSTKNGEKVTAQKLLRYLKTLYPAKLHPRIAKVVNALPPSYFKGRVSQGDSSVFFQSAPGNKRGSNQRAD